MFVFWDFRKLRIVKILGGATQLGPVVQPSGLMVLEE